MKRAWSVLGLVMLLTMFGFQNCGESPIKFDQQTGASTEESSSEEESVDSAEVPALVTDETAYALYGLWEYGNIFGEDPFMCDSSGRASKGPGFAGGSHDAYQNPGIGCVISTPKCSSGKAVAEAAYEVRKSGRDSGLPMAPDAIIDDVARDYETTPSIIKTEVVRIWKYVCVPI